MIELIIAIVIMVILTTIGVASFNSASRANAIQQQAQEIKSLARKLRTDASAAIKPSGNCQSLGEVYGTYITFQLNSANYSYGAACFDKTTPATSYSTPSTETLPTGMIFTGSGNLTILYSFNGTVGSTTNAAPPVSGNFPSALSSVTYLTINDGTASRNYRIGFSPSGLVCEEKATPVPTTPCAE